MLIELNDDLARRVQVHAALADPGRLMIVDRLLSADASPSELQAAVAMSSNLIAHHLRVLEGAGIIRRTRSEGDRRRTYLSLIPAALETMLPVTTTPVGRVVFVCSQNSARSQLAVAVWERRSSVPAASAGTHPADAIHPGAVAAAARHDLPMQPQTPRGLDDVLTPTDLVIAVCDNAHEELPANVHRIHWSVADPARGGEPAFDRALSDITNRIDRLASMLHTNQPMEPS